MTTEYIKENSYELLPHLVLAAQLRETPTYKELGEKLDIHWRLVPHCLGFIRDDICLPRGLPLINAIVINGSTGLPGDSFLPEGSDHLTDEEYLAAFELHRDQVFTFSGWDQLLSDLGLKPIDPPAGSMNDVGREYARINKNQSGAGETSGHKRLKSFVAANPQRLGLLAKEPARIEFLFISGDRCDVVFKLGEAGSAVVEVKNGPHRGELVKGVYQAVKYRALLVAEESQGEESPVHAFLVAYEIPKDVSDFASRFNVVCRQINRRLVQQVPVEACS